MLKTILIILIVLFVLFMIIPVIEALVKTNWDDEGKFGFQDEINYQKAKELEEKLNNKKKLEDKNKL